MFRMISFRGYHIVSGNTALAIHGMRSEDAEKGSTLSDGSAYQIEITESTHQ